MKRQKLYIADIAKDREIISIQDVLAINSVCEKRSVVMDLFSCDSAQYVKELQIWYLEIRIQKCPIMHLRRLLG